MAVFTGNGSASSPSFTFSSDTDSGFYLAAAAQMRGVVQGEVALTLYNAGTSEPRVGIGENGTFPSHTLDIAGPSARLEPGVVTTGVASGYVDLYIGRAQPAYIAGRSQDWYSANYALEIGTSASASANKTFIKFVTEGNTAGAISKDGDLVMSSGATGLTSDATCDITSTSQADNVLALNGVEYKTYTAGIFGGTSTTFRIALTDYEMCHVRFAAQRTNFGSSFVVWEGYISVNDNLAYNEVVHSKTSGGTISYTFTQTSGTPCTFDWVVAHAGSFASGVLMVTDLVGNSTVTVTSV